MQEKIMGESFWSGIAAQRQKSQASNDPYSKIEDIIKSFEDNHVQLRSIIVFIFSAPKVDIVSVLLCE